MTTLGMQRGAKEYNAGQSNVRIAKYRNACHRSGMDRIARIAMDPIAWDRKPSHGTAMQCKGQAGKQRTSQHRNGPKGSVAEGLDRRAWQRMVQDRSGMDRIAWNGRHWRAMQRSGAQWVVPHRQDRRLKPFLETEARSQSVAENMSPHRKEKHENRTART